MKKLLVFLLLSIITIISIGQQQQQSIQRGSSKFYPRPETVPLSNITISTTQNGWAQIGQHCAGCSSFFYQIARTNQLYQAEDGRYYYFYYFYFYSNSYYPTGEIASTYLTGVTFSVNGITVVQTPYILLEAGTRKFGAWIRTSKPDAYVRFNVLEMSVF